jgi:copper homeostasis protein
MVLIESAIDSVADAERSVREGAHRLEVCGDLGVGGITPSRELLAGCLALGVPCIAMARPTGGSFVYDDLELQQTFADASEMLSAGAHGVVFGCLRPGNLLDEQAIAGFVRLTENAESVFHRAFDDTPDAIAALDILIASGATRVLTAGHAPTAADGAAELAMLIAHAAGRITVLPGGGIRGANVRALVERTGATEVHARGSAPGVIAAIRAALS